MLSWLIVGAGVHGVRIAHTLLRERRVPHERIRLLDPEPVPLDRWRRCVGNARVRRLRSPSVHHLGLRALALEEFAREQRVSDAFAGEFRLPSRRLFDLHATHVVESLGIAALTMKGTAHRLLRLSNGWRVETESGTVESRRVVLAIGRTEPLWPDWARVLRASGVPIRHLYGEETIDDAYLAREPTAVVGLGLGAAECALAISRASRSAVALFARHEPRRATLDVNQGWGDPGKTRRRLARAADPPARRRLIERSRNRGSMPPAIAEELLSHERLGLLSIYRSPIQHASTTATGGVSFTLEDGTSATFGRVVLATGFEATRPGGRLLDDLVFERGLSTGPCGFPWVDPDLQWDDGLFVSGPLAELALGPQAPNIIGASLAAARLRYV